MGKYIVTKDCDLCTTGLDLDKDGWYQVDPGPVWWKVGASPEPFYCDRCWIDGGFEATYDVTL